MNRDLQKFLKLHYYSNSGFFSYIHICAKTRYLKTDKAGKVRSYVTMKPCHYLKVSETGTNSLAFFENLYPYTEYYITANGFRNSKLRKESNLFTYYNIVMDIDCHQAVEPGQLASAIRSFLYFLKETCKAPGLPLPNTIIHTGRGVQLWWATVPMSFQLKTFYKKMQKYLKQQIQAILDSHDILEILTIDNAASGRLAGLYRLPTSYNAKSKSYATLEFWHDDALNPMDYLDCFSKEPEPARMQHKNNAAASKKRHGHHNLYRSRERMLYHLFSMREDCVGYRDLACFILANAYLSCNQPVDKTLKAVSRLNESFTKPLPYSLLTAYLSSSLKKPYLLTNRKIIEMLRLTKKEQQALGFYSAEEKKQRKKERRNAKCLRNAKIAYYYIRGNSQTEIADKVGCSQATVSRVLKTVNHTKARIRMSAETFYRSVQSFWHAVRSFATPERVQLKEWFSFFYHRSVFSLQ